ncbi:MAG: ECF transporter S component [Nitrososphaeria archaeon]|nr:ECF transporter S component [Nitrososphaeria archaeon]
MSGLDTRSVAAAGVMGALVCVATMLIQLPIPATEGFFNVGDALVIVSSLTFGPIVGGLAGGLGSALADALGGWYNWVPFTLVIKGAEGLVAGYLAGDRENRGLQRILVAWVVGGLVMVSGYFLVQVYLYGLGGALVELPFNFVQMLVAGIVGIPISIALQRQLRL